MADTGEYFCNSGVESASTPFLDEVPIRFGIDNPEQHYHVRVIHAPSFAAAVTPMLACNALIEIDISAILCAAGSIACQPVVVQYVSWILGLLATK